MGKKYFLFYINMTVIINKSSSITNSGEGTHENKND